VKQSLQLSYQKYRRRGSGNVGDASFIRVFQAAVRRMGDGFIVFHALHRCAISMTNLLA
jgi:hypothetical protein